MTSVCSCLCLRTHPKMSNRLLGLLSLACLAMACVVSPVQAQCTPATCPPGPVTAYFEYSNCTGAVYYTSSNLQVNICYNGTSSSSLVSSNNEFLESRNYFSDGNCGADGEEPNYVGSRLYYGTCLLHNDDVRNQMRLKPKLPSVTSTSTFSEFRPLKVQRFLLALSCTSQM